MINLTLDFVTIDEYIVPEDEELTYLYCANCNINHLYISRYITIIDTFNCNIKKITLGPGIYRASLCGCNIEDIAIYEPFKELHVLDLRNNKLTDVKIKIPYIIQFNIIGNPGIKFKYLNFLFQTQKWIHVYDEDDFKYTDMQSDYLEVLFEDLNNLDDLYDISDMLVNKVFVLEETYINLSEITNILPKKLIQI